MNTKAIYFSSEMKKFLLAFVVVFILFWVGTLLLISNPLTVSTASAVKVPAAKVNGFVLDTANWPKWWPGKATDSYHYSVISQTPFSMRLLAQNGSDTFTSELVILPATLDSTILHWTTLQPASNNPFTRIKQYNRASGIKQHFQLLLDSLTAYLQDRKKMYGMDITVTRFKNPFMISNEVSLDHYPTVGEVYSRVNGLRSYAQANGAVAVDSPMVNVEKMASTFLLRTALPISKKLEAGGGISSKEMVLGNTLLSSTTGGQHTVEQSLEQMHQFIDDHRLTSPAIPFQVWQTNRQQQPDSSQWVTRLYYPVF